MKNTFQVKQNKVSLNGAELSGVVDYKLNHTLDGRPYALLELRILVDSQLLVDVPSKKTIRYTGKCNACGRAKKLHLPKHIDPQFCTHCGQKMNYISSSSTKYSSSLNVEGEPQLGQ